MILEAIKAFILGVVEGITEWLPISSTGHMIIVDQLMQLQVSSGFLELFLVVIQVGAILAVVVLYFGKLNPFSRKKDAVEKKRTWRLWGMIVIGCVPAAVIGIAFDSWFHDHFYNAVTVSLALIFYGIAFIVIEYFHKKKHGALSTGGVEEVRGKHARVSSGALAGGAANGAAAGFKVNSVDDIDVKTAAIIGAFQVLAIIPGTSRSGSTIIGGLLAGCSRVAAAEFSFFLAIPVMLGWGLIKTAKYLLSIGLSMAPVEIIVLVVGTVTAFVVSYFAIKFLVGFVKKHSFIPFGIYRIVVGVIVIAFFAATGGLF